MIFFFQFVFLPECCDFVGRDRAETLSLSEPLTGATVAFYKTLAKTHGVWLSVGGFHEVQLGKDCQPISDRIYNTHLIIDDCGELVEKYQKLHLFDVDTPEFKFRESSVVHGGTTIVAPLQTPIGSLGLMIVRIPLNLIIFKKKKTHFSVLRPSFPGTEHDSAQTWCEHPQLPVGVRHDHGTCSLGCSSASPGH